MGLEHHVLTLNAIIRDRGLDPADVVLVRHKPGGDKHPEIARPGALLQVWRAERAAIGTSPTLDEYQSDQVEPTFPTPYVMTFLPDGSPGSGGNVFAGLYHVGAWVPHGLWQDNKGNPGGTFSLERDEGWADLEDRLVIDWATVRKAPSFRGWIQSATNEKPILEIADQEEPDFPGFRAFICDVDDLAALPRGWRQTLRSTSGVYLLTDIPTGRHYVGSAKGGDGLLGRWGAYREGRSGGNLGLREAAGPFRVTVLETFAETLDQDTVERVESVWKDKLGARLLGFNRN